MEHSRGADISKHGGDGKGHRTRGMTVKRGQEVWISLCGRRGAGLNMWDGRAHSIWIHLGDLNCSEARP